MTFSEWLLERIEMMGLSYSELGRRGGISHSRISQVVSGDKPGADFCVGIARGLGLSPEEVLRKAGILPSLPPLEEHEERLLAAIRQVPRRDVDVVLRMLNGLNREGGIPIKEEREMVRSEPLGSRALDPNDVSVIQLDALVDSLTVEELENTALFFQTLVRMKRNAEPALYGRDRAERPDEHEEVERLPCDTAGDEVVNPTRGD